MANYIDILKKLNKKCINDIPISCIIVKNNKIISKGYNTKYNKNDPLGHAEINAIKKASKKLKSANLNDCILYVTLKPCKMCQEVIQECRIKKVYYYLDNNKNINNTVTYIKLVEKNNFEENIINFFKQKR